MPHILRCQAYSVVLGTEIKMNSEKFFWLNDLELLGEEPGEKLSQLRALLPPLSARHLPLNSEASLQTKLVEVMEFQLNYFKS